MSHNVWNLIFSPYLFYWDLFHPTQYSFRQISSSSRYWKSTWNIIICLYNKYTALFYWKQFHYLRGTPENKLLLSFWTPKYLQQMQDVHQMTYGLFTISHVIWKVFQALVWLWKIYHWCLFCPIWHSFAHTWKCSTHMELVYSYLAEVICHFDKCHHKVKS